MLTRSRDVDHNVAVREGTMTVQQEPSWLAEEIAGFFAAYPTPEQILTYRPSARARKRLDVLLAQLKRDRLTPEAERELDAFEHAEMLMQLVMARVRK
jgi:hypothetical protein